MAAAQTQTPMSPNNETTNMPIVAETHLQMEAPASASLTMDPTDQSTGSPAGKDNASSEAAREPISKPVEKEASGAAPVTIPAEVEASSEEPIAKPTAPVENMNITPIENAIKAPEVASGKDSSTLVVHHLNNSRSQRLLWLLEELEVPYEIKKYERTAEMRAPKELKDVHPLGKSPIITDGNVTLAESGAITQYLIEKYGGKFRPVESGKIDDLYFTHYAEGTLMPILVNKVIFTIIPQRTPILLRPLIKSVFATVEKKLLVPEIKANCALIESHLEKSKTGWFAGGEHPTSADFMMCFPVETMFFGRSDHVGPKMKEFVERIHARPAYKRGLEKGGKYDYA